MKKLLTIMALLLCKAINAQPSGQLPLNFSGLYSGRHISTADQVTYSYLRFYEDGTVWMYRDTVGSVDSVKTFLGRNNKYSFYGTYVLNGDAIRIEITGRSPSNSSNNESLPMVYTGMVFPSKTMHLGNAQHQEQAWFDFFEAVEP